MWCPEFLARWRGFAVVSSLLLAAFADPPSAHGYAWWALRSERPPATSFPVYDAARDAVLMVAPGAYPPFDALWAGTLSGEVSWSTIPVTDTNSDPWTGDLEVYDPNHHRLLGVVLGDYTVTVYELTLGPNPTRSLLFTTPGWRGWNGQSIVYDSARDRLILHGGTLTSPSGTETIPLNWTYALTLATQSWAELGQAGSPPPSRRFHEAVYDPVGDQLIAYGGWVNGAVGYTNSVSILSFATDAWTTPTFAEPQPAPQSSPTIAIHPPSHSLIAFGGPQSEDWRLSLAGTPAWSVFQPAGPGDRKTGPVVYDGVHDRFLRGMPEVWSLELSPPAAWARLGDPVPTVLTQGMFLDPVSDRMVGYTHQSELYTTPHDDFRAWTMLDASGATALGNRNGEAVAFDAVHRRVIVFGGGTGSGANDTWTYDLATGGPWAEVTPTTLPPASNQPKTCYDAARDRLLAFGGYGATLWCLELSGTPTWHTLATQGPGPPALDGVLMPDPSQDRVLLYRGGSGGGLWALALAGTPTWTKVAGVSPFFMSSNGFYDPIEDRVVFAGSSTYDLPLWAPTQWRGVWIDGGTWPGAIDDAFFDATRNRIVVNAHDRLWTLAFADELAIPPVPTTGTFGLRAVVPNPAASDVTIRFSLTAPARAVLTIVDAAGRRVATPRDGNLGAGDHVVRWNAADAAGRRVPPGVYFGVLESAGARSVRRIAIIG